MGVKLTLTGLAEDVRETDIGISFDMVESGLKQPPKGLPAPGEITFTVFCTPKQFKKAGLTLDNVKGIKLLVAGAPTLDIPLEQCPGEIGVICTELSVLPDKEKEKKEAAPADDGVASENAKPVGPAHQPAPVEAESEKTLALTSSHGLNPWFHGNRGWLLICKRCIPA